MTNTDPTGFSPEDTQSIPIVLPLQQMSLSIKDTLCERPHGDPNHQVCVPATGAALWFVSDVDPQGTRAVTRVDDPECPLLSHDDRTDADYRNRLLLKALLHTALGLLEGGDYS